MPITSFTAIDFETAKPDRSTICQVGLVRVINGKITEKIKLLVQPPDNDYAYRNIEIHGITPSMTRNELTFDKTWLTIKPFIINQNVVAHNGPSFDFSCLKKTLDHYKLDNPEYNKYCTYKIFGAKLYDLCNQYNIKLEHHDALSDAMACAELFLIHLKSKKN